MLVGSLGDQHGRRSEPVRLSVITDEISQDLEHALGVCADLGIRAVELRAVGGANIVSHDQGSLRRIRAILADGDFGVCAISDRKSTRLNSSHANISYAVFCLKKNHLLRP